MYGATYTDKGGKSAAKENVIKEIDKYLGDIPGKKTVDHFGLLEGQCRQIPYAYKVCYTESGYLSLICHF